jgi:hypothetical protein
LASPLLLRSNKIGCELLQVALFGDSKAHMGAFFAVARAHDEEADIASCVGKQGGPCGRVAQTQSGTSVGRQSELGSDAPKYINASRSALAVASSREGEAFAREPSVAR